MENTTSALDALLPAEMAAKAEQIGVKKANLDAISMFTLAVLAGAFIALGAIFSTTVVAGAGSLWPYGVVRLLAGLVFTLGLGTLKPELVERKWREAYRRFYLRPQHIARRLVRADTWRNLAPRLRDAKRFFGA